MSKYSLNPFHLLFVWQRFNHFKQGKGIANIFLARTLCTVRECNLPDKCRKPRNTRAWYILNYETVLCRWLQNIAHNFPPGFAELSVLYFSFSGGRRDLTFKTEKFCDFVLPRSVVTRGVEGSKLFQHQRRLWVRGTRSWFHHYLGTHICRTLSVPGPRLFFFASRSALLRWP